MSQPAAKPGFTSAAIAMLRRAIECEQVAIDTLLVLIRREQHDLTTPVMGELDEINQTKHKALAELDRTRAERLTCMREVHIPSDAEQGDLALAALPELSDCWKRLRDAAKTAMTLNSLNGKLVALRLQVVASRLEVLYSAGTRERMYKADGRTGAISAGRVIAAA